TLLRSEDNPDYKPPPEPFGDVLPVGEATILSFLLYRQRCQVWKSRLTWKDPSEWAEPRWEDAGSPRLEEAVWGDYFHEPFMVFARGADYFFLTASGKVYATEKDSTGQRRAAPLWAKADQPVGRVITDADAGRTFCFTLPKPRPDGTTAKPVYFE